MLIDRRELMAASLASAAVGPVNAAKSGKMYGLIGKMLAHPGKRDALLAILLEEVGEMPGCLSYVIAEDPTDANAIWITEAWESETSHKASLSLPNVRAAIAQARPLIAGFGESIATEPVGGIGLGGKRAS